MAFLFRRSKATPANQTNPDQNEQGSVSALNLTPERFWAEAALFNDTIDEKLQNDNESEYHFVLDETDFLEKGTYLGSGSLGSVHAIKIRGSSIVAVGKTEHYHRKDMLRNERNIIKDLQHHHIVQFLGSFEKEESRRPEYTLVMSPVGDSDLGTFLDSAWMPDQGWEPRHAEWLKIWFGCLSSALDYMHSQKVRHEDIKPANIIHRRERVFFTDFSSSSTFQLKDTTSTETPALATQRYAAPEARTFSHGARTDVFSLGCVFLEMLTVSQHIPLDHLRQYCSEKYHSAGYQDTYKYRLILHDLNSWFLGSGRQQSRDFWKFTIRPMMHPNRKERPTARSVLAAVHATLPEYSAICFCSRGAEQAPACGDALQAAVSKGDLRLVQELLYQGVDIDALDDKGENALYVATFDGNCRIVDTLLRWGANVDALDDKGENALYVATFDGNCRIVDTLLRWGANVDAYTNEDWGNCLHVAVQGGDGTVVRMLLEQGMGANPRCSMYGTPLSVAARNGSVELIQLLLDHGAEINDRSNEASSSLYQASRCGHVPAVQILLDNGADVNASNINGTSALLIASLEGNVEVVRLLLNSGADLNGRCYEKTLHLAVLNRQKDIVEILLKSESGMNALMGVHESALHAALGVPGNEEVVHLLSRRLRWGT